ncbi:hypothetical protein BpHYR1_010281 [Brachionus plicatilis]|uniref:Uncharacterized protein n=1 Tax=Brachionus plicatilis TaxID=10195 RepID=A0A3M7RC36_BRAPC|nr:hypothetical protein BpHYR1_010281 [Brachionus plicatilis]
MACLAHLKKCQYRLSISISLIYLNKQHHNVYIFENHQRQPNVNEQLKFFYTLFFFSLYGLKLESLENFRKSLKKIIAKSEILIAKKKKRRDLKGEN